MPPFSALFLAAALSLFTASSAVAQSADPDWLDALRSQLSFEENCEVDFFLNMREREGPLGATYSARVQCSDGRQFDATRAAPETEFKIETCAQAVCGLEQDTGDRT